MHCYLSWSWSDQREGERSLDRSASRHPSGHVISNPRLRSLLAPLFRFDRGVFLFRLKGDSDPVTHDPSQIMRHVDAQ